MTELKPCPFCGGNSEVHVTEAEYWYVICLECGTISGIYSSEDEAMKAWNRRVSE